MLCMAFICLLRRKPIMTESTEKDVLLSGNCDDGETGEERVDYLESYEEITIIVTRNEPNLVLVKGSPSEDPDEDVESEKFVPSYHTTKANKKRFKCTVCRFTTAYQSALRRHALQRHGGEAKKHQCDLCGFLTHRKGNLEVHTRIHTNEKPYRCEECDFAAAQKGTVKQHMLQKHGDGSVRLRCEHCGYSTRLKKHFARHKLTHCDKRLLKCSTCKFATAERTNLKEHVSNAHGAKTKTFKCGNCDYLTDVRKYLVAHMSVHTGEKPFRCDTCDYRTASKSNLNKHTLLRHSEEAKQYECEHCKYSTHIKGHLVRHVRVHTKEKPFKCNLCDFASAQSGNLKQHTLVRHGG